MVLIIFFLSLGRAVVVVSKENQIVCLQNPNPPTKSQSITNQSNHNQTRYKKQIVIIYI
jgi:hypothetical protein